MGMGLSGGGALEFQLRLLMMGNVSARAIELKEVICRLCNLPPQGQTALSAVKDADRTELSAISGPEKT